MKHMKAVLPVYTVFFLLVSSCSLPEITPSGTAYIYGVTLYDGIIKDLDSPDDDARDMAALFSAAGYTVNLRIDDGFDPDAGEASIDQLETDIDDFITGSAPGEMFIFYFAGHGGTYAQLYEALNYPEVLPLPADGTEPAYGDGQDEYLFFHGTVPDPVTGWDSFALKDDELKTLLEKIPGHLKLVIIDACYSGGFIGDSPFTDPVPQDYSPLDSYSSPFSGTLATYFGFSEQAAADISAGDAFVITAAGELEVSKETLENGVFTLAFLEAAASGDLDGNGYITLNEIYRHIDDSWSNTIFHPHIAGSAVDLVLFKL